MKVPQPNCGKFWPRASWAQGVFNTDDCRGTYEELKSKGVQFVSEPADRPYGVEAVFKDNSGNWFSLTQPSEGNK